MLKPISVLLLMMVALVGCAHGGSQAVADLTNDQIREMPLQEALAKFGVPTTKTHVVKQGVATDEYYWLYHNTPFGMHGEIADFTLIVNENNETIGVKGRLLHTPGKR